MRIGIIGGGLMGVALGYFLAKSGEQVTLLEQGLHLGGLNDELVFEDGLAVPRYQHALLPSDAVLQALCAELGLKDELIFQSARAGFVNQNTIHPMSNIFDFLSFSVLGLRDRFRLGRMILQTRGKSSWQELDTMSAKEWLVRVGGQEAFERIWRPLLEAKFDGVYDKVAATYIWAWLNRMSSVRQAPQLSGTIGYLKRGHFSLIKALADALQQYGGKIQYDARVREIELQDGQLGRVRTHAGTLEFDMLVAAVATPIFARLIPAADAGYLARLEKSTYLGLICPVMVLDTPLSNFWTLNLTDPTYPFATIIQTPHPEKPNCYIVHLPRYTAPDNDWMGVADSDIREAWITHLKKIFPAFKEEHILHFAVSRSRYVEPIHNIDMLQNKLDIQTPYAGLFLANTAQVYPQLPTSEAAVAHARLVADRIRLARPVGVMT
ncbi:MAG: FAD-dependent oxidoreductase [Chloroflexi bacterium]|nr:FAD-dependent oxidoreductase [Chloroflexota bacterium]MCC6894940.1 FAD-dependent oxidoreductase [Anaerolineae bacterium]